MPNSRSSSPPSYKTSQKQASMSSSKANTASRGNGVYTAPRSTARDSSSSFSSSAAEAELRQWASGLERMQDARLERQRYVMSNHKSDEVAKLALGAKVERALARRMVGQDATFSRKKPIESEKRSLEVKAN